MSSMTSLSFPAIKISSGVPIYAPQTFVDPVSRRDFEGFAAVIERGSMFGCRSLGSGDPGDYLIVVVRVTLRMVLS
jgi:hypothetical protein